jgi:hypothetical protein
MSEGSLFRVIIMVVKMHLYLRRLLALISLAAILIAAVSPITLGIFLAFFIPVWFFFAAVVSVPIASADEGSTSPLFIFLPSFSPRPPPIR